MPSITTVPPRGRVRRSSVAQILTQVQQVQAAASAAFWASPDAPEAGDLSALSSALCGLLQVVIEARRPGMEMFLGGVPGGHGVSLFARPSRKPAQSAEALAFDGVAIRNRGQQVSLTDAWKAAGGDPSRKPAHWLRSEMARAFIAFVAENERVAESQLVTVVCGDGGCTWAHWQVAMAYAKYLSPKFHAWCNSVVRERMESMTEGKVS